MVAEVSPLFSLLIYVFFTFEGIFDLSLACLVMPTVSASVLCVMHQPDMLESLREILACLGHLIHGVVFIPHVDQLNTVFNGKSMTLLTFSEQIYLLGSAQGHLRKNVLSLLTLGLPLELCVSVFPHSQLHTSPISRPHNFKS